MKFIRDFNTDDTKELFHKLRAVRIWFIGFPVMTPLVVLVPLVIRFPKALWWTLIVYPGGILFVTLMIAEAYGRILAELEKRIYGAAGQKPGAQQGPQD